jgi:hypothetical protein
MRRSISSLNGPLSVIRGPKPTSNHFRRCCGAARQTGLSLHVRNSMMGELTMCGHSELLLRLRQWLPLSFGFKAIIGRSLRISKLPAP